MAVERTLSIIKPDAVRKAAIGPILSMVEGAGLRIAAMRMVHLSTADAGAFYAVHSARPFYGSLVEFMTSGPVVVSVLEGEDAVAKYRALMGATNPAQAADGTIRKAFATDIEQNAVHGSDAAETAAVEIAFFFPTSQIYGT